MLKFFRKKGKSLALSPSSGKTYKVLTARNAAQITREVGAVAHKVAIEPALERICERIESKAKLGYTSLRLAEYVPPDASLLKVMLQGDKLLVRRLQSLGYAIELFGYGTADLQMALGEGHGVQLRIASNKGCIISWEQCMGASNEKSA